jgi:hypothetical protein
VSSVDALRACDVRWGVLSCGPGHDLGAGALPPSTASPSGLMSIGWLPLV